MKPEAFLGEPCWSGPTGAGSSTRFEQLLAKLQEAHLEEMAKLKLEVRRLQGRPPRAMGEGEAFESLSYDNEEPRLRSAAVEAFGRATWEPGPRAHPVRGDGEHEGPREQLELLQPIDQVSALPPRCLEDQPPQEWAPLGPSVPPSVSERDAVAGTPPAAAQQDQIGTQKSLMGFLRKTDGVSGRLHDLTESTTFDLVFCGAIFLSAIFFAAELELTGREQGAFLSVYLVSAPSWDYEAFFNIAQWVFSMIFAVELLLRLGSKRLKFFRTLWNWIDAAIVATTLSSLMLTDKFYIDPKPLRVARLVRLLRLMHFFRYFQCFDSLYLLVASMKQSFHILGWTCLLGLVLQLMLSLLITEFLYGVYFCETITEARGSSKVCDDLSDSELVRQKEVYLYYGTFVRSMFTMFELLLANWPPAARVLSENVHWSFMIICVLHKLVLGFASVAVVTGVFTKETFKVAELDDHIMVFQTERQVRAHAAKMRALFAGADVSQDGTITIHELRDVMKNDDVRMWLASMGMSAGDVDRLFALIDSDGSGEITMEEMITGVSRLKGTARSLDLATLMDEHGRLCERVSECLESLAERKAAAIEGNEVEARRGNEWAKAVVVPVRNRMVMLKWASDGVEDQVPAADVRIKGGPVTVRRC